MSALRQKNWLRWWWPVLVWAALMFGFSTDAFSGEHTSRIILPVLHWLFPAAGAKTLAEMHFLIRKCAHVTEYFLLSLLLARGFRAGRSGWLWTWGLAAVLAATGWAALDELHQAFVPSRGPSMIDVLIDATGAFAGQIAFAIWARLDSRGAGGAGRVDSTKLIV